MGFLLLNDEDDAPMTVVRVRMEGVDCVVALFSLADEISVSSINTFERFSRPEHLLSLRRASSSRLAF